MPLPDTPLSVLPVVLHLCFRARAHIVQIITALARLLLPLIVIAAGCISHWRVTSGASSATAPQCDAAWGNWAHAAGSDWCGFPEGSGTLSAPAGKTLWDNAIGSVLCACACCQIVCKKKRGHVCGTVLKQGLAMGAKCILLLPACLQHSMCATLVLKVDTVATTISGPCSGWLCPRSLQSACCTVCCMLADLSRAG